MVTTQVRNLNAVTHEQHWGNERGDDWAVLLLQLGSTSCWEFSIWFHYFMQWPSILIAICANNCLSTIFQINSIIFKYTHILCNICLKQNFRIQKEQGTFCKQQLAILSCLHDRPFRAKKINKSRIITIKLPRNYK